MNSSQIKKLTYKIESSSFLIRVYFRQNNNWQGTIQWLESNQIIPYKSTLDLILLLNEAVEQTHSENGEKDFRSWHETALDIKAPAEPSDDLKAL